ncbi:hypothetical protein pb186bvf_003432 [Paramecium bursaria]
MFSERTHIKLLQRKYKPSEQEKKKIIFPHINISTIHLLKPAAPRKPSQEPRLIMPSPNYSVKKLFSYNRIQPIELTRRQISISPLPIKNIDKIIGETQQMVLNYI